LPEGDVFVNQFTAAALDDPRRIALAERVNVLDDPAKTVRGSAVRHAVRVDIHLTDGTAIEQQMDAPRAFASDSEFVGRFRGLAPHGMEPVRVERPSDPVPGLDDLPDAGDLTRALAP